MTIIVRQAFSLVEMLVVMIIIAVLAGLILAGIPHLQFSSRALETENRMNLVTQGLAALATGGQITQAIQERLPVSPTETVSRIGGVIRFGTGSTGTYTYQRPAVPGNALATGVVSTYHRCWPDARASGSPQGGYSVARPSAVGATAAATAASELPLVMAFPWGRQRLYIVRQNWYQAGRTLAHPIAGWSDITWPNHNSLYGADYKTMSNANRKLYESAEPHNLSHLRPYWSGELLQIAGILPSLDPNVVNQEPRRRQPWNDAWGNPLAIGVAIFQPPAFDVYDDPGVGSDIYTGTAFTSRVDNSMPNFYGEQSEKAYGFTRAAYISVAAAGPTLATPLVPSVKDNAVAIWKQVNEICNRDGSGNELWRIDSFASANPYNAMVTPPWSGVRRGRGNGALSKQRCFLLAPVELQ